MVDTLDLASDDAFADVEAHEPAVDDGPPPADLPPLPPLPTSDREAHDLGLEDDGLPIPASLGRYVPDEVSPLSPSVRTAMEASFGADLGGVRVHEGAEAVERTDAENALAVTEGLDIYLGDGGSATPLEVLAHEVAHVVQQGDGEADPDGAVEAEADDAAASFLAGGAAHVRHRAGPGVHAKRRSSPKPKPTASPFLASLGPRSLTVQPDPVILRPGIEATIVMTPHSDVPAPASGATFSWKVGFGADSITSDGQGVWPAFSKVGTPFVDHKRMPGAYWVEVEVALGEERTSFRRPLPVRDPDPESATGLSDAEVQHQLGTLRDRLATEKDPYRRPLVVEALDNLESMAFERGLPIRKDTPAETGALVLPSGPGETTAFPYQKAPRSGGPEASRAFVEAHLARSGLPFAAAKAALEEELARADAAEPTPEVRAANARAREQLALIADDQGDFRPRFVRAVEQAARDLVHDSETGIRQVLLRYGISAWPEDLGFDPELLRDSEAASIVAQAMVQRGGAKPATTKDPGAEDQVGLANAARELLGLQARLHAVLQARVDLRLAMGERMRPNIPPAEAAELDRLPAPPGHDAVYVPGGATPEESLAQTQAEISRIRRLYLTRWLELEQAHPVLAAYRDRQGSPTDALADLTAGGDEQKLAILGEILPKLGNLTRVRRELDAKKLSPLSLPPAVALAKQRLLVPPGSVRNSVADDEVAQGSKGDAHWAILALTFALIVVTAIPTGGSSTIALLKVGAELGGLALDAVMAGESVDSYQTQSAANNTDLDRARALSADEPSLAWLVVDLLAIGIDLGQVRAAVRDAGVIRRAAQAGTRVGALVDDLNRLGRQHELGDLGARVESNALPAASVAAPKAGTRSPEELAALRQALPPELRMLPLDEAGGVPGSGVRVHYGDGELRLQIGPEATARHVGSHASTARRLLRYQGPLGLVRRLIDRILTFLRITPGFGTVGFEARHEVRKLREILGELRELQSRLDVRVRSLQGAGDAAQLEAKTLDRELADIQEQLEHHQAFVDSYQPGRGFIAAEGGRTTWPVAKRDLKTTVKVTPTEVWMTVAMPVGEHQHDLLYATIPIDKAGKPMAPELSIEGHFAKDGSEYAVSIYDDVTPPMPGADVGRGAGARTPITRFALDKVFEVHRKHFGGMPAELGGSLADQNKLNFQREFAKAKKANLEDGPAAKVAISNISFGHHRIAVGYDDFAVDIGKKSTWQDVDLGSDLGVQKVPNRIKVTARPTAVKP